MKVQILNEAYSFSFNSEYLQIKKEYERLRKCNDFMKDINADIRYQYFKIVSEDEHQMELSCTDELVEVQEEIEALCRKNEIDINREDKNNTIIYHIDTNFTVEIAPSPEGTVLQLTRS